jgi:HSP20 family protein
MPDSTATQPAKGPTPLAKEPASLKPVPKGDLTNPITEIYNSIARRAFEIFEDNGRVSGSDMENWLQAESELLHPADINIVDAGDSLDVRAEVPGFTTKDLEVSVEPECLTIMGKRETKEEREKEGKPVYSECYADEILRVIDLPVPVDTAKVTATLKDGVLELEMPKAAPPKKIKVEAKAA